MLTLVLEALVIAWLPGAVLFRLPMLDRPRRAGLEADERVFWQVVLSLALSLSITLVLAVAGRYSFDRLLIADVGIAGVAAALGRFDLRLGGRRPGWVAVIPLLLIALGLWRFFPTAEYIIGGKDPGTYINEGIQIAQRGAITPADPVVASVPNFARGLFFPSHERPDYYSSRFMGFFLLDPDNGRVVGQFPHLFPASIAIGYGLDGLSGARKASAVWAILGLLAVYFAGARLLGRPTAAAAAALLAVHLIEVWFARYPNAEVVMQALLFAAILASARAHGDGDGFFAPIAGWLLGLLLFLRIDAVLAIAGVGSGLALAALAGGRVRITFVASSAAVAGLAAVYLTGPMYPYLYPVLLFLSGLQWWHWLLLALGGAAGCVAIAAGSRMPVLSRRVRAVAPVAAAGAVAVGAVYALWLRHPGGRLTDYDAYALRTFAGLYFTLPAVLAAVAGYAVAARRWFWRDPALFMTAAVFSFSVFYKLRIVPEHFWMARRFLPVILPAGLLFACALALAGTTTGSARQRIIRGGLGAAFLVLLAAGYQRSARPILDHVEYAGIIPRLEQLATMVHDDDLLLVESRDASDTHVLALPLAYIYDRDVLVLASRLPDKSVVASFLDWAHTRYRRVLFMGGGGTDLLSSRWEVTAVASERFQVPEYEAARAVYPRAPRLKEFDYSIYALTPTAGDGASAPDLDVDVGFEDDLHVLRFHAKEAGAGFSYRWSRDVSYVVFASLPATVRQVTLWLDDGGRPPAAPPAEVTVAIERGYDSDQLREPPIEIGRIQVRGALAPYTVSIPPALAAAAASGQPVRLKLSTSVWIPEQVLGTPDDRDLGVMVDRVLVQ